MARLNKTRMAYQVNTHEKKDEKVIRTILEHRLIILGLYLPNVRDR